MRSFTLIATLLATFWAAPAFAQPIATVGALRIEGAFSRATLPRAPTGGAYFTIVNTGLEPDRLVSGSTPAAEGVELHEMTFENDVARMRALPEGIEIPAGETVALEPSGTHIMLTHLTQPLVEGETLSLTLRFERAGPVTIELPIGSIAARKAP